MNKIVLILITFFCFSCKSKDIFDSDKINLYFQKEVKILTDYLYYYESKSKNDNFNFILIIPQKNDSLILTPSRTLITKGFSDYFEYNGKYFLLSDDSKLIKNNIFLGYKLSSIKKENTKLKLLSDDEFYKDVYVNESVDYLKYNFLKGKVDLKKSDIYYRDEYLKIRIKYLSK